MNEFLLERTKMSIGTVEDEPDDLKFWMEQTPEIHLDEMEFFCKCFPYFYLDKTTQFLEIDQCHGIEWRSGVLFVPRRSRQS